MLRLLIFVGTVLAAGCPSKSPEPAKPVAPAPADTLLRIRIAQAEARRADGFAELKELAASKDPHARALAVRGLGRSGSAEVIGVLEAALADPVPEVVIAAASAIGVLASIDETLTFNTATLVALLGNSNPSIMQAAAEALGRAGAPADQAALRSCKHVACVLALGRYGRRKIALEDETRKALTVAAASDDRDVRYAATYAMSREHEPGEQIAEVTLLAVRINDDSPETRAVAIAGLARRKAATGLARKPIEGALRDPDWRVAVEAVRALANADDAGRTLVATSLTGRPQHVIHEALRAFIGKPLEPAAITAITPLLKEPGWTGCLAAAAIGGPSVVDAVTKCQLPDHLKLPLLVDVSDPAAKRAALRVLLANDDPRVRGAGLGMIASTWEGADAKAQQTIVSTLTSALTAKNTIVAGNAVEAVKPIYEGKPDPSIRAALDAAIVARADGELDVELSSSLFEMIEKQLITSGAAACRKGLSGHPTRAKAAAKCLRALGEAVPADAGRIPEIPPVDVSTVIGHKVIWHLATSRGEITIELRPDVAPWAVASIAALTQAKQHDGLELHRVVPNFVVQGGDPTSSGWGGPGYTLPAEPSGSADAPGFVAGGVGMADAGPDSAGSQWFIMHSRAAHLDGRYTWVGRVTAGQAIADVLVIGDKVDHATIEIQ